MSLTFNLSDVSQLIHLRHSFGCNVLTTCSPNNFDLVKSRGADHVFNYRDPDCLEQIQKVAGDDVMYILDCIGSEESGALCAKALSSKGGRYHSVHAPLLPVVKDMRPEDTVIATTALAYTLNGKKFRFANPPMEFEAVPEDYQFALRWKKIVEGWLERGGLKPHPPEVKPGGIEGILEQLMALTDKSPSGKRIVLSAAN